MNAKFISIGQACPCAYHIRRVTGQREAHFFDWIVTSHKALMDALPLKFSELLPADRLRRFPTHLLDESTGLRFYAHDFPGDHRGHIRDDYAEHVDAVREKYLRRAERTQALFTSGNPVVVVRYGQDTPMTKFEGEIREIKSAFARLYPDGNFRYLWLSHFSSIHGDVFQAPETDRWQGSDAAWDRALRSVMAYAL